MFVSSKRRRWLNSMSPLSRVSRCFAITLLLLLAASEVTAQAAKTREACTALAKLDLPEATITNADVVKPRGFKLPPSAAGQGGFGVPVGVPDGARGGPPGGPRQAGLPGGGGGNMALAPFDPKSTTNQVPFCRIAATLRPSGDSNIKVEVWMPLSGWNGKLLGAGNFGWAGSIMYGGLLLGLERGYATVSTDTGHDNSGAQGEFALGHPDKEIDYGFRASHTMTVDAKQFIKAFYGQSPRHSYWFGCSLGGQMGMTEIQRFPEDYDGAIIGAPANPIVDLNAYQIWPSLLVADDPARELGRAKAAMLQAAVIDACDGLDGAKDGEIENPLACRFDPKVLLCKGNDGPNCLTKPQEAFVEMLYSGPISRSTGKPLHTGAAKGNEDSFGNYNGKTAMGVATALFRYMVFQDPNWDWKTLDMDRDIAYGNAVLRPINGAADPNLKPFFDRGGKLLMYHGWDDGNSPETSINYLNEVKQTVGVAQTEDSMRLFTVPGMGHCMGGTGCDVFDKLATLDAWEQTGKAPERIMASKLQDGKVVRTHPLCAYPATAKYKGSGDLSDGDNFNCVQP